MMWAARFATDTRGATMIEYGLIAALIVLAMAVGVGALGVSVQDLYQKILDAPFNG